MLFNCCLLRICRIAEGVASLFVSLSLLSNGSLHVTIFICGLFEEASSSWSINRVTNERYMMTRERFGRKRLFLPILSTIAAFALRNREITKNLSKKILSQKSRLTD
jgi:hypothetical protein